MNDEKNSPVTNQLEQATAYVAVSNGTEMVSQSIENQDTKFVPADGCIGGTALSGTNLSNPNLGRWDGKPLQPGILYWRNLLMGLPVLRIKENRSDTDRAKDWQEIGQTVGIAQPIKLALAPVAKAAGFTLGYKDPQTGKWYDSTDGPITNPYVLLDGYGRSAGHDLELKKALSDSGYKPFDVPVLFDDTQDPGLFRMRYISINQDVQKTKRSDLLRYADKTKQDKNTAYYNSLLKDHYIAKAAQIQAYGKELKIKDIKDISSGKAVSVDASLTDAMQQALEVYKKVLSGSTSAKILKGVPLAAWTRDKFKSVVDKNSMLQKIRTKFENMTAIQLTKLQEAKGVKGDKAQTTEIVLRRIFDEILGE